MARRQTNPNKRIGSAKQSPLGECCPVMKLVLSRPVPLSSKWGLEIAPWVGEAVTGSSIILNIPKSKNRGEEHADATYAELSFCPFCGAKLAREKS